jgi:hypothetical protein
MKFLIQHNLINPLHLAAIEKATAEYPREFVGCIPFTREITSNEPLAGVDFIPYGSTLLTTIAADKGWKGLHFDLEWMNYRRFLEYRSDMLNDTVMQIAQAVHFLKTQPSDSEWFTRPSEDLKQYSGQVLTASELVDWFSDMLSAGDGTYFVKPDFDIVLSRPQVISAEWRWFIVGHKIISGSMYRAHGKMRCAKELDSAVIKEAQALADYWLPDNCVVMDTALVGNQVKVIEFNCINASGFYDHDVGAIFKALWEHHLGK